MRPTAIRWLPAVGLLLLGLGLRLIDLTDQPLDFNASRQLYSAIIARAIYYEDLPAADLAAVEAAVAHRNSLERLEPPLLETLVAATYRLLGGERLWVARLYSIAFWILGGIVLYTLAHQIRGPRLTAQADPGEPAAAPFAPGALIALAFYLFLPLAVYASRSFQPDPLMVCILLLSFLSLYQWDRTKTWKWALLSGLSGGLAVLIKGVGAYFAGAAATALVLARLADAISPAKHGAEAQGKSRQPAASEPTDGRGDAEPGAKGRVPDPIRRLAGVLGNPQIWAIAFLMLLPAIGYYYFQVGDNRSLYSRFVLNRIDEVLDPSLLIRWLIIVDRLFGLPVVLISFAGIWLAPRRARTLLAGLWVGYLLYGVSFPQLIITHDYYHLPLVALVALSLAPAAGLVAQRVIDTGWWARIALAGAFLLAIAYPAWITRSVMLAEDFSQAGQYWQIVAESIPPKGRAVGYSQDYGFRLMYYGWRRIDVWPREIGSAGFERRAADAEYFVVTAKNQMSAELALYLEENFPVLAEGGGYVIYDLSR